jgi:hypothetical protein
MPNTWEYVLQKLQDNKSYANKVKSEFVTLEMNFLGNILFYEGIRSNLTKVQTIKKWQSLSIAKRIKSIYRLANLFK